MPFLFSFLLLSLLFFFSSSSFPSLLLLLFFFFFLSFSSLSLFSSLGFSLFCFLETSQVSYFFYKILVVATCGRPTRSRCSLEQLHRLHRYHPSRYPGRAGGRDAHCHNFHFFIASQSSRSMVAVTRSRCSLPENAIFRREQLIATCGRGEGSRYTLPQFFTPFFFMYPFWTVPSDPPGNHKNKYIFNYVLHPSTHTYFIYIFKINYSKFGMLHRPRRDGQACPNIGDQTDPDKEPECHDETCQGMLRASGSL
ncbi:hypothetical protein ACOSQ4_033269 [Xanthoceras sorbifolium]